MIFPKEQDFSLLSYFTFDFIHRHSCIFIIKALLDLTRSCIKIENQTQKSEHSNTRLQSSQMTWVCSSWSLWTLLSTIFFTFTSTSYILFYLRVAHLIIVDMEITMKLKSCKVERVLHSSITTWIIKTTLYLGSSKTCVYFVTICWSLNIWCMELHLFQLSGLLS